MRLCWENLHLTFQVERNFSSGQCLDVSGTMGKHPCLLYQRYIFSNYQNNALWVYTSSLLLYWAEILVFCTTFLTLTSWTFFILSMLVFTMSSSSLYRRCWKLAFWRFFFYNSNQRNLIDDHALLWKCETPAMLFGFDS